MWIQDRTFSASLVSPLSSHDSRPFYPHNPALSTPFPYIRDVLEVVPDAFDGTSDGFVGCRGGLRHGGNNVCLHSLRHGGNNVFHHGGHHVFFNRLAYNPPPLAASPR